MHKLSFRLFCFFMLTGGLILSSCTGDKVTADEIRMIIGPYGGEVLGPKGSKLVFPPDALTYEVPIILSEVPEDEVPQNGDMERISSVLWMRPEGLTFNRPVTVEMSYRASQMTEEAQLLQVAAFTSPRFMPDWQELAGTAETATHTFVFEIEHFSIAALYRLSEEEAECRCAWLGSWCADPEATCAGVAGASLTRDADECAFTLDISDAGDESLSSGTFNSCPIPGELELNLDGGDCGVAYDNETATLTLNCGDCSAELSEDLCD